MWRIFIDPLLIKLCFVDQIDIPVRILSRIFAVHFSQNLASFVFIGRSDII